MSDVNMFEKLPKSEQEDFVQVCRKCKVDPVDFRISFETIYPTIANSPLERRIRVERVSNGAAATFDDYRVWILHFDRELASGGLD